MSSPRRYANIGHNHVAADISDLDLSAYAALADNETVTGAYTFSNDSTVIGGVTASNLVDKSASETIDGVWTFDHTSGTGLRIRDGDNTGDAATPYLGFWDSTPTRLGYVGFGGGASSNLQLYNEVSDAAITMTTTGNGVISMSPAGSGYVQINSGRPLRFYDSTGSDFGQFNHDGSSFYFTAQNTSYFVIEDCPSGLLLKDGGFMYVYESSASSRNAYFGCEVTAGTPSNKAFIANSDGGAVSMQAVTIADDAIGYFQVDTYAMCWLINTYNGSTFAHFSHVSTQAPVDYGSGAAVAYGATNPDLDNYVNIWPSASNQVAIKNRMGSSRTFYLLAFGRDKEN